MHAPRFSKLLHSLDFGSGRHAGFVLTAIFTGDRGKCTTAFVRLTGNSPVHPLA